MILRVQQVWNVMPMVIAHASRDSLEANVMNVNQISLVTNVTAAKQPFSITHYAKVCTNINSFLGNQSYSFISECKCNPDGSTTTECDTNGDCKCKEGFIGSKCDTSSSKIDFA